MLVIGDALAMVLLEARGFNKEDFARYHPAGRLGRALLLKVHQIMRGEDQLAKVTPDTPIVDVIKHMTTCVPARPWWSMPMAPSKASLRTAISRGIFRRRPTSECAVGEFMTRKPITISGDKLAAEVLHVLQMHRIDDIVVVDAGDVRSEWSTRRISHV